MRRTPPVAKQVIPPFRPTNALLQARLIDFDTGSALSWFKRGLRLLLRPLQTKPPLPPFYRICMIMRH